MLFLLLPQPHLGLQPQLCLGLSQPHLRDVVPQVCLRLAQQRSHPQSLRPVQVDLQWQLLIYKHPFHIKFVLYDSPISTG